MQMSGKIESSRALASQIPQNYSKVEGRKGRPCEDGGIEGRVEEGGTQCRAADFFSFLLLKESYYAILAANNRSQLPHKVLQLRTPLGSLNVPMARYQKWHKHLLEV